jgi:hypothetical protein
MYLHKLKNKSIVNQFSKDVRELFSIPPSPTPRGVGKENPHSQEDRRDRTHLTRTAADPPHPPPVRGKIGAENCNREKKTKRYEKSISTTNKITSWFVLMLVEVVLRIWSDPELFWSVRIRFRNKFVGLRLQRSLIGPLRLVGRHVRVRASVGHSHSPASLYLADSDEESQGCLSMSDGWLWIWMNVHIVKIRQLNKKEGIEPLNL